MLPTDSAPELPPVPVPVPAPDPDQPPAIDLPGELATFSPPARLTHEERHKYLVAYDIRDPRRLTQLHKRLKDWGRPVQFSVFEALLTGAETERMWIMVANTIDTKVDWVVLYRLSRPFDEAVRHIGAYNPDLPASDLIIFV